MSAYPATENRSFNHLCDLERELEAARATIAEQKKRIGELEAERDQFRGYAHEITKALTGLVGGGSEMFAGRLANGTDREMFKADLPFCVDRIRRRFDAVHEAIKGEHRERQRRESAEAALRTILAADKDFIAAMGEFWEGDPLTDACADARKHFTRYSDAGNDSADGRRG